MARTEVTLYFKIHFKILNNLLEEEHKNKYLIFLFSSLLPPNQYLYILYTFLQPQLLDVVSL